MPHPDTYDCIIIGGGIGGLSLSIQLAALGYSVAVIEKETYPFHKVCGEYLSNESTGFIEKLGVPLHDLGAPSIERLLLSSVSGITIKRPLDIGGVGISRYTLDKLLAELATSKGVTVLTNTKVEKVQFENDVFTVKIKGNDLTAKIVCGCFGRQSNMDVQLNRKFRAPKDELYVGVKYHLRASYDRNRVELHNFKDGYCGMSAIEDGKVNFSYITKAANLARCNNSIPQMERTILSRNPFLGEYLNKGEFLMKPVVISHVSFDVRSAVTDHILMVGDAAGTIAPLTGNGMSMALNASKIASAHINNFLQGSSTRQEMENRYTKEWNGLFSNRIKKAQTIQSLFGKPLLNNASFLFLKLFPFVVDFMSKDIHGERF